MLDLVGPAVFWLAAAFKARRITEPGQRPLALALVALAIGLTLDIPSVYVAFDHAVGVPNLTNLVEHSFALVGVFLVLTFLEQVTGRPTWTWGRSLAIAGVLVAVCVLFVLASPRPEASDFTRMFDNLALIKAYWIVTIGYFGICLAALLRLAIGHARQAGRREVRVGFAAVGVGVVVGVVYSALKIAELVITGETRFSNCSTASHSRWAQRSSAVASSTPSPPAASATRVGKCARVACSSASARRGERPCAADPVWCSAARRDWRMTSSAATPRSACTAA